MDLYIVILSDVSQTEKKYHMTSLIYGINKKNDTNELIYKTKNRLIDLENEFMVAMVAGGRRTGEREEEGKVWDGHIHTAIF